MGAASAEPLLVKHQQGEVHAFLVVRSDSGKLLGIADEVNIPMGKAWQSRLTIRFRDGSIDEDTATYTQTSVFRLLTDHHVQKGPSFPKPSDIGINMTTGDVTYHEETEGRDETKTQHMDLPADLGNGIMPMLLQNMPKSLDNVEVSYLVAAPKPRLIKIAIHPDGVSRFHVGDVSRLAKRYNLHFKIGGIQGLLAPIVGKEPPDMSAWVSTGDAPTFLKLYGFLYLGGPMWRLELASPGW